MTDAEKKAMMDGMDAAAEQAKVEFEKCKSAADVCKWYAANYAKAGHKRLGRFLASKGK